MAGPLHPLGHAPGRAHLLDEPPGGEVVHDPDGGVLDVSEFDYRTATGVRLEGRGIKPDENITPTRNDIYTRRDAALEVARKVLNNR